MFNTSRRGSTEARTELEEHQKFEKMFRVHTTAWICSACTARWSIAEKVILKMFLWKNKKTWKRISCCWYCQKHKYTSFKKSYAPNLFIIMSSNNSIGWCTIVISVSSIFQIFWHEKWNLFITFFNNEKKFWR